MKNNNILKSLLIVAASTSVFMASGSMIHANAQVETTNVNYETQSERAGEVDSISVGETKTFVVNNIDDVPTYTITYEFTSKEYVGDNIDYLITYTVKNIHETATATAYYFNVNEVDSSGNITQIETSGKVSYKIPPGESQTNTYEFTASKDKNIAINTGIQYNQAPYYSDYVYLFSSDRPTTSNAQMTEDATTGTYTLGYDIQGDSNLIDEITFYKNGVVLVEGTDYNILSTDSTTGLADEVEFAGVTPGDILSVGLKYHTNFPGDTAREDISDFPTNISTLNSIAVTGSSAELTLTTNLSGYDSFRLEGIEILSNGEVIFQQDLVDEANGIDNSIFNENKTITGTITGLNGDTDYNLDMNLTYAFGSVVDGAWTSLGSTFIIESKNVSSFKTRLYTDEAFVDSAYGLNVVDGSYGGSSFEGQILFDSVMTGTEWTDDITVYGNGEALETDYIEGSMQADVLDGKTLATFEISGLDEMTTYDTWEVEGLSPTYFDTSLRYYQPEHLSKTTVTLEQYSLDPETGLPVDENGDPITSIDGLGDLGEVVGLIDIDGDGSDDLVTQWPDGTITIDGKDEDGNGFRITIDKNEDGSYSITWPDGLWGLPGGTWNISGPDAGGNWNISDEDGNSVVTLVPGEDGNGFIILPPTETITDGDGTTGFDIDGDGKVDIPTGSEVITDEEGNTGFDIDGDGIVDFPLITDEDGNVGFDIDGDGTIDLPVKGGLIDSDGDGSIDGFDLNGDGESDINIDLDNDLTDPSTPAGFENEAIVNLDSGMKVNSESVTSNSFNVDIRISGKMTNASVDTEEFKDIKFTYNGNEVTSELISVNSNVLTYKITGLSANTTYSKDGWEVISLDESYKTPARESEASAQYVAHAISLSEDVTTKAVDTSSSFPWWLIILLLIITAGVAAFLVWFLVLKDNEGGATSGAKAIGVKDVANGTVTVVTDGDFVKEVEGRELIGTQDGEIVKLSYTFATGEMGETLVVITGVKNSSPITKLTFVADKDNNDKLTVKFEKDLAKWNEDKEKAKEENKEFTADKPLKPSLTKDIKISGTIDTTILKEFDETKAPKTLVAAEEAVKSTQREIDTHKSTIKIADKVIAKNESSEKVKTATTIKKDAETKLATAEAKLIIANDLVKDIKANGTATARKL